MFPALLLLLHSCVTAQDQGKALVGKKGAHFIGTVYSAKANSRARLEILRSDSTHGRLLLDSTFSLNKTIVLAIHTAEAEIKAKHPEAMIVVLPDVQAGIYIIRFSDGNRVSTEKVIIMK